MKKQIMKKWVRALRSGRYEQTTGRLCRVGKKYDSFCCLGVLTELYIQDYNKTHKNKIGWSDSAFDEMVDYGYHDKPTPKPYLEFENNEDCLSSRVVKWAGLNGDLPQFEVLDNWGDVITKELAVLNDKDELNFKQIADIIEENWEQL